MRPFLTCAALMVLLAGTAGCAAFNSAKEADESVEVEDGASLINYLQDSGLELQDQGPVTATNMTDSAHEYLVTSGGHLYVFEYPTGADAVGEVAHFEGTRDVDVNLRQIYRRHNLVVLYFGDDPRVERALVRAMGSRVA